MPPIYRPIILWLSVFAVAGTVFADEPTIADGNRRFAIELYQASAKEKPGENVIISPWSITAMLGILSAGARGETLAEIRNVMHTQAPPGELASYFQSVARNAVRSVKAGVPQSSLQIRNVLCLDQRFQADNTFLHAAEQDFLAKLMRLDLRQPETAARDVNDWVRQNTQGRIQQLVTPQDLKPPGTTVDFLILNAVFFRGTWEKTFSRSSTKPAPFYLDEETSVTTPMMHDDLRFMQAAAGKGFKLALLPYKSGNCSFVVLLPDKRDGLAELEEKLTVALLDETLAHAKESRMDKPIDLKLPKFRFNHAQSLQSTLESLGMPSAFSPEKADLTGIAPPNPQPLQLFDVLHQTDIDVDEIGTIVASASMMGGGVGGGPPEDITKFHADHPFLFLIREETNGTILFIGRLAKPEPANR